MASSQYEVLRQDIAARGVETPLEITSAGVVLDVQVIHDPVPTGIPHAAEKGRADAMAGSAA